MLCAKSSGFNGTAVQKCLIATVPSINSTPHPAKGHEAGKYGGAEDRAQAPVAACLGVRFSKRLDMRGIVAAFVKTFGSSAGA